jgi:hypothetical protein
VSDEEDPRFPRIYAPFCTCTLNDAGPRTRLYRCYAIRDVFGALRRSKCMCKKERKSEENADPLRLTADCTRSRDLPTSSVSPQEYSCPLIPDQRSRLRFGALRRSKCMCKKERKSEENADPLRRTQSLQSQCLSSSVKGVLPPATDAVFRRSFCFHRLALLSLPMPCVVQSACAKRSVNPRKTRILFVGHRVYSLSQCTTL